MAGGCFGLCGLLQRKRKNRRGPGAGPAQEPEEEVQHFQPLQQDPGRDRPAEQDRARGRFRRAVQRLLKFVGVRRGTATTAPPELVAQPDTSAAELEGEPDVSSAPMDCAASGDMAPMDCAASGDMAPMDCAASGDMELTDGTATSEVAAIDGTETTDMAAIDCGASCVIEDLDGTDTSVMTQLEGSATTNTANCDTAPTGDTDSCDMAPVEGTNTCDTALIGGTETTDVAPMDDSTATCDTALADTETSSDTAPTDVRAEADATTEGITNTDCMALQSVTDAASLDILEQKGVPSADEVQILARHLQSQCPERRRLALRGLLVLSVDPSMAKSICSLSERLLELLRDGDGELVRMTLSIFRNVLQDEEGREGFSPTAPRLAEALRPVFDHDNSHVQLLSIHLFRELMELEAEEGTWLWEMQVHQSLIPLFFRWHDENQSVAKAAREALLWAARFLQRRDLEQLLKTEQPFRFCDCLMEKELSRRGEHLRQALPFLQSPQEPLREAAVRFMGVAGWHMREQQQDLWPILKALGAMSQDDCPSTSSMRTALMATYRSAVRAPRAPLRRPMSLQPLQTTAQGPLPSAAAAPADAGPN